MSYNTFKQDLMEAQIYEDIAMQRVLKMFDNQSYSAGRIQREDNYREIMFDFEIISDTGESLTYEVKRNKKVDEYGYYFFEIRDDKGMYSGLAKTKAEFHILVNGKGDEYVLIKTSMIKQIIKELVGKRITKLSKTKYGFEGFCIKTELILKYATMI